MPGSDHLSLRTISRAGGSKCMIRDFSACFDAVEFTECVHAKPGQYVIERAFVG